MWTAHGYAAISPSEPFSQDRLLSIPTTPEKDIDLAETLLFISHEWDPSLKMERFRAAIDQLTANVKRKIKPGSTPREIVNAMRQAIHQDGGYRYTEQVDAQGIPLNPAELFIHGLLETKRGYCMNLSLLYLIVGERLGLPLYGVGLPNHFLVRYESPDYRVNIEATERGDSYPDSYYETRFGISAGKGGSAFFMKNLGKKQTLGAYFSNVGMVYYNNKQIRKAVTYLELATAINKKSIEAHNNLGNIYSDLKEYDQAIAQYLLALDADPNNMSTLFNLGIAYSETGEIPKAIESFLQVVQINPGFTAGHQGLVQLYLSQEHFFGALIHLNILEQLDPENLKNTAIKASIYQQMGNFDLAMDTLNKAERRFPRSYTLREKQAEIYYHMENFDKAIEYYRWLIEEKPEVLRPYIQMGWTHYRKGEIDMGIGWTRRGLNVAQGSQQFVTLAHMNLGFFYLLNKDFAESKNWYRKVLSAQDPASWEGMFKDLKDASHQFPDLAEVEYFTGWLYFEAGQMNKAETHLERFLNRGKRGPLVEEAREMLTQLHPGRRPIGYSPAPKGRNENRYYAVKKLENTPEGPENMVLVASGFFLMGSNDKGSDERPRHKVYLDDYYIDKYEVSAGEYAEFLNDVNNVKGYYHDNKVGILDYDNIFRPKPGFETHPINNVSWYGADAYCKWKKKRLPTEAEWEKAARGQDGRMYPWGNEPPTPNRARFLQDWGKLKFKVSLPVTSLPEGQSPYGARHMSGNIKEWVDDWYDREYYKESNHHLNPKGPPGGEFKVIKGGSWRDLRGFIYSSFRNNSLPKFRLEDYGFRCAQSVFKESPPKKFIRQDDSPMSRAIVVRQQTLERQ